MAFLMDLFRALAAGQLNGHYCCSRLKILLSLILTAIHVYVYCSVCHYSQVTDYGLPTFLFGRDFQESEQDQYKRKMPWNVYL